MLVIAGDWKTAGHRLRKPAQGTAPAIGRRHSPCNRTQAQPLQSDGRHAPQQSDARHDPPAIRHKVCPLQSDTRHGPHCRMQTTTLHSLATCSSKRKCTPLDASLVACLGHSTPLPSEGGAGGWVSGLGVGLKCKEGSLSALPWKPSVVERGRLPTLPHCIAVPSA